MASRASHEDALPLMPRERRSEALDDPSGRNQAEDERLLSEIDQEVNRVSGQTATADHTSAWFFACIFAVAVAATLTLAGLLLSLNPIKSAGTKSQPEDHPQPPKSHPGDGYVLDPEWDFASPNRIREYEWTITDGEGSPDGVLKPMMLINHQFPGPLIEINEGDVLSVKVSNKASNATALHWHGIFQNGTNWMDGAAGVTQCPIAPGQSYEYKFNVTGQSGTYFYHGHQGVQALDGLVGPMIVHSNRHDEKQYSSDRVVLLQDWWYDSASSLMWDVLSPGVEDAPVPNTALINGINQAVCSDHPRRKCTDVKAASLPRIKVAHSETHRLRFINVGGYSYFQVAVDEHSDLQIVEVDGNIVEPTSGSPLLIAPGQRYSAVLRADHTKGAFWLRARMVTSCFAEQKLPENGIEEAKAIVHYTNNLRTRHDDHDDMDTEEFGDDDDDEGDPVLPQTTSDLPFLSSCRDLSSTTDFLPSPSQAAPEVADYSWHLRVNLAIGDWRLQRGVLNSSSFRPNLTHPTLHRVLDGLAQNDESFVVDGINKAAFNPESELVISNKQVETVDMVLQNMDENSHPFHLHGTSMWVLGAGHGYFPGYEALGFLPEGKGLLDTANKTIIGNPLKRDTISVEGFGWALLRFVADNPGVWLFHCHVIWHSEAGMGMQFVARVDDLRGLQVPGEARGLCDAPEEELLKGAPPRDEVFYGFRDGRHRRRMRPRDNTQS